MKIQEEAAANADNEMPVLNISVTFKECLELVTKEIYDGEYSKACKMHDAFGAHSGPGHNCLGCNFAASADLIKRFLDRHETLDDMEFDVPVYIMLLYLAVERIEVVLDIVKLPEAYRDKHFKVFRQIRKWANFIKHPGAFMLTHHANYEYQGDYVKVDGDILIDDNFIRDHYTGHTDAKERDKQRKSLYEKLGNKDNVVVLLPDIVQLTKKFCYSHNRFVSLVTDNEVYREVLADRTTLKRYFSDAESFEESGAPLPDRKATQRRE